MSTRLSAPKDGIVASARPKGWAAESWMAIFDELGPTHHAQLARGRTLARSGRVRDLWFSPGLASAEVVTNRNTHRVTIRVRVFEDEEWGRVVSRSAGVEPRRRRAERPRRWACQQWRAERCGGCREEADGQTPRHLLDRSQT